MTASPESNPSPEKLTQPNAPRSLTQVFMETFLVLGRYLVIVYPVFLFFIISSMVFPRTAPTGDTVWAWWLIFAGLSAAQLLFKAGWSLMMFNAVKEWSGMKQTMLTSRQIPPDIQRIPFGLLKDFLPGIGIYGPSFLLGGIGLSVLSLIPVAALLWVGYQVVGISDALREQLMSFNISPGWYESATKAYMGMSTDQHLGWFLITLAIIAIYALINGLTIFWQPFVIIRQCNPFKAYLYSIRHVLRHPFNTLVILIYIGISMATFSLMSGMATIGAFIGNFLWILSIVFFGLFMFMYLDRFDDEQKA